MKVKNKKIIFVISALALATSLSIGYVIYNNKQETKKKESNILQVSKVKDLMLSSNKNGASYLTGKVIPNAVSKINADSTKGKINNVYVKVGDSVKKGQKLFSYSNPDGQMAINDAANDMSKTQNKINQLTEAITSKEDLLNKKYTDLTKVNDKIYKAAEEEKAGLEQEKSPLEESINTMEIDLQATRNELNDVILDNQKAEKTKELTDEKYSNEEIVSEVDGIVQKIDDTQVKNGAVSGGQSETFMEIMDTSMLRVQGSVDEFKKDDIKEGQAVTIIDRKDQSKNWTGKIDRIDKTAMEGKEDSTISKFNYEVVINKGKSQPSIGNHVYVQPEIEESKTIDIPAEYVLSESDQSTVWKVSNGKVVKQKVTIGDVNKENNLLTIKEGLEKEDEIVFPNDSVTEGMKVAGND